jgi:hypothetical protein
MEKVIRPLAFVLAVLLLTTTVAPDLLGWGVPSVKAALQTVTFDDRPGENQPLTGEYPSGVISWGDGWYHAGPTGPFTTKSLRFNESWRTNVTFTFVAPRRLVSLHAYNSGSQSTTISISCSHLPTKHVVVGAGQAPTIDTGWIGTCTRVTLQSGNGRATFFDNLVTDGPSAPAATTTTTPAATATTTSAATATTAPAATATTAPAATPTPTVGAGATATPTVGPAGVNKLVNPGFESGITGWVPAPWASSVSGVQTVVVRSGSKAFSFHGKTNGSYVYQDVPAVAGQTVTFSGWVSATYATAAGTDWEDYGHAHLKLMAYTSSTGKLATYPLVPTRPGHHGWSLPPGGWLEFSFTQVLPPGTAYLKLQFDTYGLNGTVFIDDLFVGLSGP